MIVGRYNMIHGLSLLHKKYIFIVMPGLSPQRKCPLLLQRPRIRASEAWLKCPLFQVFDFVDPPVYQKAGTPSAAHTAANEPTVIGQPAFSMNRPDQPGPMTVENPRAASTRQYACAKAPILPKIPRFSSAKASTS